MCAYIFLYCNKGDNNMNILIIGGSYFLGRLLTMKLAKKYHVSLVNRGTYSMKQYGVKEYHFDRHDTEKWKTLENQSFDVVVDMCAYQRGEIDLVLKSLKNRIKHYILISTVDVYKHHTGLYKDEMHILEDQYLGEGIGEYIIHKILLEHELQHSGIPYTILRPGNIYGPYNYAPRESLLIKKICEGEPLMIPIDAKAKFQLVYVEDVVNAVVLCIEKKAYQKIYNIVDSPLYQYQDIYHELNLCHLCQIQEASISQLLSMKYPLPYPIYETENENYNGEKIKNELGLSYTSLHEGMSKTFQAFYHVYKK